MNHLINTEEELNLDAMEIADLEIVAREHQSKGYRQYAFNKINAIKNRLAGDVKIALECEKSCEFIYSLLPSYLKW